MSSDGPARLASHRVHDALRAEIVAGTLAPGDRVPSERALAQRLGVNRQAVREALKRLEQAGLVRITHGGPTRVLDWREASGLDLLVDLARDGGDIGVEDLGRSVIELRAVVGIDAARRCATRADDATLARIAERAEAAAALVGGDVAALEDAYAAMWRRVVEGSGNVAYRLAFNSLMGSLPHQPALAEAMRPGDADAIRRFGAAMRARDAAAAIREATALLEAPLDD